MSGVADEITPGAGAEAKPRCRLGHGLATERNLEINLRTGLGRTVKAKGLTGQHNKQRSE